MQLRLCLIRFNGSENTNFWHIFQFRSGSDFSTWIGTKHWIFFHWLSILWLYVTYRYLQRLCAYPTLLYLHLRDYSARQSWENFNNNHLPTSIIGVYFYYHTHRLREISSKEGWEVKDSLLCCTDGPFGSTKVAVFLYVVGGRIPIRYTGHKNWHFSDPILFGQVHSPRCNATQSPQRITVGLILILN